MSKKEEEKPKEENINPNQIILQPIDENGKEFVEYYDSDDEKYTKYLCNYDPKNAFPKTIEYPNQKNFEKNTKENINNKNNEKIKYNLDYISKLDFGNTIIYDLSIEGNLLLVVGGEYLKIYNIEENYKLISSNLIKTEILEKIV